MGQLTKKECDEIRSRLLPLDNPDLASLLDTVDTLRKHLRALLAAITEFQVAGQYSRTDEMVKDLWAAAKEAAGHD